jgi:hypothetical protein
MKFKVPFKSESNPTKLSSFTHGIKYQGSQSTRECFYTLPHDH